MKNVIFGLVNCFCKHKEVSHQILPGMHLFFTHKTVIYLKHRELVILLLIRFAWHRYPQALQRHILLFPVSSAAVPRCHTVNN